MRFMNDYNIASAVQRHTANSHPNRLGAALVVQHLAEWADRVSDGWAYWPKPARSAARLMEIADQWPADEDVTDAELAAAVRPVKSFLTKCEKVPHRLHPGRSMVTPDERERILRGAEVVR